MYFCNQFDFWCIILNFTKLKFLYVFKRIYVPHSDKIYQHPYCTVYWNIEWKMARAFYEKTSRFVIKTLQYTKRFTTRLHFYSSEDRGFDSMYADVVEVLLLQIIKNHTGASHALSSLEQHCTKQVHVHESCKLCF